MNQRNLDRKTGDKIADLLFSLNRDYAATLILVTRDNELAARCQRRLRLVDGQQESHDLALVFFGREWRSALLIVWLSLAGGCLCTCFRAYR